MSQPGEHLHTAYMLGHPVRFFRSPLPEEFVPWHAVDDLHRALGVPCDMRLKMQGVMCRVSATKLRTIHMDGQLVLIAGHGIAQGTLKGMASSTPGLIPDSDSRCFAEYDRAIGEAAAKSNLMDGLRSMNAGSCPQRKTTVDGTGYVH